MENSELNRVVKKNISHFLNKKKSLKNFLMKKYLKCKV